jgi:hypothetical protein
MLEIFTIRPPPRRKSGKHICIIRSGARVFTSSTNRSSSTSVSSTTAGGPTPALLTSA